MDKEFWQRKLMEKLEEQGLVDRRIIEDYCFRHEDDDAEMEETESDFDNEIAEIDPDGFDVGSEFDCDSESYDDA